jgi:hypothetical protein
MFDSILIAFGTAALPPNVETLRHLKNGYRFAPLSAGGVIMTADIELWQRTSPSAGRGAEVTLCPSESDVLSHYSHAHQAKGYFVCGLTNEEYYSPIESQNESIEFSRLSHISELRNATLTECGFDIVDRYTGLSALANIGYSSENLKQIELLAVRPNDYGLLETYEQTQVLIPLISAIAPEHAPFIGVKVVHSKCF